MHVKDDFVGVQKRWITTGDMQQLHIPSWRRLPFQATMRELRPTASVVPGHSGQRLWVYCLCFFFPMFISNIFTPRMRDNETNTESLTAKTKDPDDDKKKVCKR